jgi:phosphatidylserine/phosphatidylglycerophosphate/cardiolipin synthase-like enzyme
MKSSAIKRGLKDGSRSRSTRLITQPGDGIAPLLQGIAGARSSIDILIFRFDRKEIEQALVDAVRRGVAVRALIAWTNRGGDHHLRELETRLLAHGVLVARTANDLVRYHGKMMIVDRRVLYVLAFNFTRLDIDRSRSFGIITTKQSFVREAIRLFDADSTRQPYTPQDSCFLVSPFNSREELGKFIESAKSSLMIYDPGLRDREMVRLLDQRSEAGVEIRILGKFRRGAVDIPTHQLTQPRLHARVIICDNKRVFIGSQSLRSIELDGRREVGLIINDPAICEQIASVFEKDWKAMAAQPAAAVTDIPGEKLARKVAKAVSRELPPVSDLVESVAVELTGRKVDLAVDGDELEETVREAVKSAVKDVLEDVALGAPLLNVA